MSDNLDAQLSAISDLLETDQNRRLIVLTIVAGVIKSEKRGAAGGTLRAGSVKTTLDVMDLHRLTQYVMDGKDPFADFKVQQAYAEPNLPVVEPIEEVFEFDPGHVDDCVTCQAQGEGATLHPYRGPSDGPE